MTEAEAEAEAAKRETTIIRYQGRPEGAGENQRLIEQVFAALDRERSEGLGDGVTFVHVVVTDSGVESSLGTLAPFAEFQSCTGDRLTAAPVREAAAVIGPYRLFG